MFTEEQLEKVVIEYFEELGYNYIHAQNLKRDPREVLLTDRLEAALVKLNQGVSLNVLQQVIKELVRFDTNDVFTNNKVFHRKLTENVEVAEYVDGETIYHRVRLINWEHPEQNDFLVVNQLEVEERSLKIPDIVVFVNGLPLVVIELKSTSREDVSLKDAYSQLKNYMNVHIPSLFYYNAFLMISDGVQARAGTITAPYDRFSAWKKLTSMMK